MARPHNAFRSFRTCLSRGFPASWPAAYPLAALLLACTLAALVAEPAGAEADPPFRVIVQPQQPLVFDGQPASFTATTDPPGFESLVHWKAVTRWGFADPPEGQGPTFTVIFHQTFGEPGEQCQWLAVRAGDDPEEVGEEPGEEWKQATTPDCIPDIYVPAGEDCWETEDCDTIASFCTDPLPAGFFGEGSKQWRQEILLQGAEGIALDTRLERLGSMNFTGLDIRKVPLELSSLDLESCDPITVEYDDGTTLDWTVTVTESEFEQEQGEMVVERTYDNGGLFRSEFPVYVKYTFTRVDDPEIEAVLDTGDPDNQLDPFLLGSFSLSPWVSQLEAGIQMPVCGTAFVPGVSGGGTPSVPTRQCCKEIGHKGPGHKHVTKRICKPCPDGACYDKKKLTCRRVLPEHCDGADEVFLGESTDCKDTDRDKLPDWVENDNCCLADQVSQDSCNALSSPGDRDSDGDGIWDGDEILQGRDPCTPEP